MKKFISEFKEFISRGNVIDMAIGVVVGGAFKGIIDSLVNNIIMPVVGWLIGGIDFTKFVITLPTSAGEEAEAAVIAYGTFINSVISFIIIAFVLFLVVKVINSLRRKQEAEEPAPAPAPAEDIVLLSEIRDLLKEGK